TGALYATERSLMQYDKPILTFFTAIVSPLMYCIYPLTPAPLTLMCTLLNTKCVFVTPAPCTNLCFTLLAQHLLKARLMPSPIARPTPSQSTRIRRLKMPLLHPF